MIATFHLSTTQVLKTPTKIDLSLENKSEETSKLVKMIKSKSEQGFSILYDNYSIALYRILFKFVKRTEVADDLLQDTFVKIWKNIDQFDHTRGTLFTWMLNVARNIAQDYLKSSTCKQQLQNVSIDLSLSHKHPFGNNNSLINNLDFKDFKSKALQIDQKYAEIIDMIFFCGFTQNQTAEILNLPLGTVKTRARKGLSMLKNLYLL